ncbi:MAG: COG1361 S-layer family protein, partial [Candidatus Nanohaloarchaea archaeon]
MRKPVLILSILIILNASALTATDQVEGNPEIKLIAGDNRVAPGEFTKIQFYLMNDGQITDPGPSNLEKQVQTAESFLYQPWIKDEPFKIKSSLIPAGTIPPGKIGPLTFALKVKENASKGRYYIPVNITYNHYSKISYDTSTGMPTSYTENEVSKTKKLLIIVDKVANFEIIEKELEAAVGSNGDLIIKINNTGTDTASETTLKVSTLSKDLLISNSQSSTIFVGRWKEGEVKKFKFDTKITKTSLKTIPIQIETSFTHEGFPQTDKITTGVRPEAEDKFKIIKTNSTIKKGEKSIITGEIKNTGSNPLHNVEAFLKIENPSFTPVKRSSFIGKLNPGQTEIFKFKVQTAETIEAG